MEYRIHVPKPDDSSDRYREILFIRLTKEEKARAQLLAWIETETVSSFIRTLINERWAKTDFSDPNLQSLIAAYERATCKTTEPPQKG